MLLAAIDQVRAETSLLSSEFELRESAGENKKGETNPTAGANIAAERQGANDEAHR